MFSFFKTHKLVMVGLLIAAGAGYTAALFVGQERLEEAAHAATLETRDQLTVLASLAEVMARGGADQVTEQVIKDCSSSERIRFDDLLGRLQVGLSRPELLELSRLFDRCGPFYSQQRAVMAARFLREVEMFKKAYDRQLLLAGEDSTAGLQVNEWQQLASLEQSQSEQLARLVELQRDIIAVLLEGETPTSERTIGLLAEVKEVVEMQSYNALKMKEVRDVLLTTL